ncbi:hypothetical protein KRR38_29900 [Novosphingobium sp. G106]|uniref:hypothetical protein n=1 Tax=Novosphingobium sp. G106 TaxID=2849500 RepID=UPI001C2DBA2C|nr:hypothetical protein [Novosphingobium sp. G106]MBV1691779.1 hypothetical protein [Novosphingobium sp. G106]
MAAIETGRVVPFRGTRADPGGATFDQLESQRNQALWTGYLGGFDRLLVLLAVAGIIASFVYGAAVGIKNDNSSSIIANLCGGLLALAIVGGASSVGIFAGFLFGLPRTLTSNELRGAHAAGKQEANAGTPAQPNPAPPEGKTAFSDVNTNLEQISDWLTKIIVGVGLTQLGTIPAKLGEFGDRVNDYFGFGGHVFAVGGGLYFLILGFFLGYVGTRVKLSLVFTTSQRHNIDTSDGKILGADGREMREKAEAAVTAAAADPISDAVDAPTREKIRLADEIMVQRPLSELVTDEELQARANALARDNKPLPALSIYQDLVSRSPAPSPELVRQYVQVLAMAGRQDTAKNVIAAAPAFSLNAPVANAETQRKIDIATLRGDVHDGLYANKGKTYTDALVALDLLLKHDGQADDSWVQTWIACANGQKYKALVNQNAPAPDRIATRNTIVAAVRRAIELDPVKKSWLATLYVPERVVNGEDDLTGLYPDPELDQLLLDAAPPEAAPTDATAQDDPPVEP